jgi:hypothetical protein
MNEPTLRFPIVCPLCGRETIGEYPVADVANALLTRGVELTLHAPCHGQRWTASRKELKQIRQYMGAWLQAAPVLEDQKQPPQSRGQTGPPNSGNG